ncbi:hypothetical protein ACJIZ3_008078 [Penstemon smallii]|uniref:HSF-type DNA-binding domain-containing protein n=1 Tax=Penstemon smallii TaxID=265156 RepID=A0ABD3T8R1_9LAMI
MAQRSVAAPFLTKTYHLVDDPTSNDVVSWNEEGTTFVVWKNAEFAKDLLPKYFKHNNFSSFVRQLNTYGFRKIVPDKWEFANDNFKRGHKELLTEIHRRKNVSTHNPTDDHKPGAADNTISTSPENSTEDFDSSSHETHTSAQLSDLSYENKKLRKDNELLSSELAKSKKQCEELVAFLTRRVKVAPDEITRIMNCGCEVADDGDDDEDESENCMKLFGVVLKRKRGCNENNDNFGVHSKEMKRSVEVSNMNNVPWMKVSASPEESSKVCN